MQMKYSLWNLARAKDALIMECDENINPFKDWDQRRGVKYYLFQNGRIIEYDMVLKNHGHTPYAQVNVYDMNGNLVESKQASDYSWAAEKMLQARFKLQKIQRRTNRHAAAHFALQKVFATKKKEREKFHREVERRMRLRELESNKALIDANILRDSVLGEYLKQQKQRAA